MLSVFLNQFLPFFLSFSSSFFLFFFDFVLLCFNALLGSYLQYTYLVSKEFILSSPFTDNTICINNQISSIARIWKKSVQKEMSVLFCFEIMSFKPFKALIHNRGIYSHTSIEYIRIERYYRRTQCVHRDWITCCSGSVLLLRTTNWYYI